MIVVRQLTAYIGTKMHVVIQQLRPFIWFCQFVGVIPFYMVNDDDSPCKTFQKFSFSLWHPVTWWFSLLSIFLLISPFFDSFVILRSIYHTDDGPALIPPIFLVFVLQENVFSLLLVVSARYIIYKHACIRRAISLVQKVHNELMVEDMPSEYIPSVWKHVFAAITFPLIAGLGMMASNTTIFSAKVNTVGLAFAALLVMHRCFMIAMITSSFSLGYLCYYIVACYIRLIAFNVERPKRLLQVELDVEKVSRKTAWMKDAAKQKLVNSKRMFGHLCQALVELNEVFSFPVLVFLTLRLISSAFSLYVAIYGLVNAHNLFFRSVVPTFATLSTLGLVSILIIFRTADLPIIQMRKLRERIFNILNEEKDLDMDMELEAVTFLQSISEDTVRMSAAGLFSVGMNLVPSLTAAIITYLIILLEAKLV